MVSQDPLVEPVEGVPPDDSLLEDLTAQLERTRDLLTGSPEEAASRALHLLGGQKEVEARIAVDLAARGPLTQPERFGEAHRLTMRALEILNRDGSRDPPVPRLGPVRPLLKLAVEAVAKYIVRSYAAAIIGRLRRLYTRRESQAAPRTPERHLLARARLDAERLSPDYGGGTRLPAVLAGGAAVPALASFAQRLGALDFGNFWVQIAGLVLLFLLFLGVSWVLLQGAGVAHRRSRLIMQQPLNALWETIGNCGIPPKDPSTTFATVSITLTVLAWFVLPAVAAALVFWL
jgi:hypothetical protein